MHSAERADGGIVGIERRSSAGSEASRGGNGGGGSMDVGPSSPFTPMAQHHGGNGGGGAAEWTPEAGASGRSMIARAGSSGRPSSGGSRPSSAGRASGRGSGVLDWSMSPPSAGGRGHPGKSPAARGRPGGFTGRRVLFSIVGVFISLATISMLLAPSRMSGAGSRPSAQGSKQVSVSDITPQNQSAAADVWHSPDPTVRPSRRTATVAAYSVVW